MKQDMTIFPDAADYLKIKAQVPMTYLFRTGIPLTCVHAHLYGFQIAFHLQSAYHIFYMSCSYLDPNL